MFTRRHTTDPNLCPPPSVRGRKLCNGARILRGNEGAAAAKVRPAKSVIHPSLVGDVVEYVCVTDGAIRRQRGRAGRKLPREGCYEPPHEPAHPEQKQQDEKYPAYAHSPVYDFRLHLRLR
eukprot:CAMPEP_0198243806 /NCGR_PEP_ID=MMETSP1446-20131203/30953_1 /TAXON_ID=1461542 ORGANISM="Unidentified sp, Strain CCMP2111" /NCGR_SAMPLE_ID=MMETSP1446 /ASSEMBLY_ACC=CAM_ASM_001112 /LENGTH=120 /DNA_ID=CAMNT_0043927733 /DNA_START=49 /DNA_END=407 /DNA_ORIENTATION=+